MFGESKGRKFLYCLHQTFLTKLCSMKLRRQPTKLVVSGVICNSFAIKFDTDHVVSLVRSGGMSIVWVKITGPSPYRLVKS